MGEAVPLVEQRDECGSCGDAFQNKVIVSERAALAR